MPPLFVQCPPFLSPPVRPMPQSTPGIGYEVDPDFLEHAHREQFEQFELPWEP